MRGDGDGADRRPDHGPAGPRLRPRSAGSRRRARPSRARCELAERIARNAPLSVAASKQIINGTQGMTDAEAWEYQQPLFASVFASEDAKEGPTAFAEKRPPVLDGGS